MKNLFGEFDAKREEEEFVDDTTKAMKAKAAIWKAVHDAMWELDDSDRASVAYATQKVLEPIVLLSAGGMRDVVDKSLETLGNIDEIAKKYRKERDND